MIRVMMMIGETAERAAVQEALLVTDKRERHLDDSDEDINQRRHHCAEHQQQHQSLAMIIITLTRKMAED